MIENLTLQTIGIIWMASGVVLVLLEVVIPGGFVVFIGVSSIITGVLSYLEIIEDIWIQFVFCSILSLLLILLFRSQVHKWFPALERYKPTSDYTELFGKEVEVILDVGTDTEDGRVKFQGSTWKAKSRDKAIRAGEKAKIIGRKNITLIVEKI